MKWRGRDRFLACLFGLSCCGLVYWLLSPERSVVADLPQRCDDQDPSCAAWAATNECSNNPAYMHLSCRRSCGLCPDNPPAQPVQQPAAAADNLQQQPVLEDLPPAVFAELPVLDSGQLQRNNDRMNEMAAGQLRRGIDGVRHSTGRSLNDSTCCVQRWLRDASLLALQLSRNLHRCFRLQLL